MSDRIEEMRLVHGKQAPTRLSAFAVALLCVVAPFTLNAQTTEPTTRPAQPASEAPAAARSTRDAWQSVVTTFASQLTVSDGISVLSTNLSEDFKIHQFNRSQRASLSNLRQQAGAATKLSALAYLETPATLASDIANEVRDASDIPDEIRRRLAPDDAQLKRANGTATKWIAASLSTSGTEPIGVIVLLPKASGDDPPQPIFVLVRGQFLDGQFHIREICYGDPLPAAAPNGNVAGSGD